MFKNIIEKNGPARLSELRVIDHNYVHGLSCGVRRRRSFEAFSKAKSLLKVHSLIKGKREKENYRYSVLEENLHERTGECCETPSYDQELFCLKKKPQSFAAESLIS